MNAREPWVNRHVVAADDVDCEPLSEPKPLQWWAKAVLILGVVLSCLILLGIAAGLVGGAWVMLRG